MKILYVGYGSSIHTARWISQFEGQPWDLHLFPVDSYYLSSALRNVTVHQLFRNRSVNIDASVRQSVVWPYSRFHKRLTDLSRRLADDPLSPPARLARLIRRVKPDLVHSFDLTGGVLAYEARCLLDQNFPPWIHSSWGSDLLHFGRLEHYRARALGLMQTVRYFMADCQRELDLAAEYGFRGELLGVFSAGGGFDIEAMQRHRQPGPSSKRRTVALKGRHEEGLLGRGMFGLKAIELCQKELADYQIVVYLPQGDIRGAVEYVRTMTGLKISVIAEHASHEEILRLFGMSRLAIALGLIDGTPHSMIEAMIMGAWPIQSNTADTAGWITDHINGNVVPPEDPAIIAEAIRSALGNDDLVDQASRINLDLMKKRKDISIVRPDIVGIYNRVAFA
ncbi:MAG: glycosyltransferase [Acidobacteria bacterium]|nr:glycosyltransferase [Acidobacteriota bacterium]